MCDPMTAITVAGAGLSAGGKLLGGFQNSKMAKLSEGISRQNRDLLVARAKMAEEEADFALVKGNYQAGRIRREVERSHSAAVATAAASNLDPTYGSPLMAQLFSSMQGQADIDMVLTEAGFERAAGLGRSASLYGEAASEAWNQVGINQKRFNDQLSGVFGAATTLLNAAPAIWTGLSGASGAKAGASSGPMNLQGYARAGVWS